MKSVKSEDKIEDLDMKSAEREFIEQTVFAVVSIKGFETNWENKQIILDFEERKQMMPFLRLTNLIFAGHSEVMQQNEIN